MKKVLLYYNFSYPLGGGDYLPLIFVNELQKTCEVTLAVDSREGVERAMQFFNVPLDMEKLKIVQLMPKGYNVNKHNKIFSFIRNSGIKKLSKNADVCISAANIIDFGRPAHHFINFLGGVDHRFDDFDKACKQFSLSRIVHNFSESCLRSIMRMRSKYAIVHNPKEHIYPNSKYVQDRMEKYYGPFNSTIFYPPTIYEPQNMNLERDSLRAVYIGRITAEKRITDIIDIIEKARSLTNQDLQLVIAGPMSSTSEYCEMIKQKADKFGWITLINGIWGDDKDKMLCSSTYAVHTRRNEEFGISVAEYLKSGLIPLVPDEGGSMEVVDNPALTYHDNEEAARILARLLSDRSFREEQQQHCAERSKMFSLQAYMERQKKVLEKIVNDEP